jgi:hypothetical protein
MGLDITAYSEIAEMTDAVFDADGEAIDVTTREPLDYDDYAQFYRNPDFPGRADEIKDKAVYSFEDSDGMRAGAYSGYNRWRDMLAKMAGYPEGSYQEYGRVWKSHCVDCWNGATGPFSELINFSDCEGVIGAAVSAKLAKDFTDFQGKADGHSDDWFREKYSEWRRMFELASKGGCVKFH